jgi:protein-S-isoprenylcysteine O-methyltransferase Ste14
MKLLENRIPPPLMFLIVAVAMWGVSLLSSPLAIEPGLRYAIVALFFVAGGLFAAPAITAFRRASTTIDPVHIDSASALVTSGIYRLTRNPMYVGLTSLLLSWAAFLAAPWSFVGPLLFVLFITRFQIIPEERAMTAKFGPDYTDYKRRARRWL